MSITPLTTEPSALYAGDTISWLIALPDYPASGGWTLNYNAVGSAGRFALTSTSSGDNHAVTAASGVTGAYLPGTYSLTKYVSHSDGSRVTLSELVLEVKPNLAGKTAAFDTRSHVKKVLDAIEAVIEGTASTDQQELSINGTTLKRRTIADLLTLRSQYLTYYRQEQDRAAIAAGLGSGRSRIVTRFT